MVLEDWHRDRGHKVTRIGLALQFVDVDGVDVGDAVDVVVDVVDDDVAAAVVDVDVDVVDDDGVDVGDAVVVDDVDVDVDDVDDDGVVDDDRSILTDMLHGEIDMRDGLKIIQLTGTRYWAVTKIGYIRCVGGDEYEILPGASVLRCKGKKRGLESLAADGPGVDYELLYKPSKTVEEINRLLVRRCLVADEMAWQEYIDVTTKPALGGMPKPARSV